MNTKYDQERREETSSSFIRSKKTLIDHTIKRYSVTLRASRNALRKKNKHELVFTRGEESLAIEWIQNENGLIDILEN